ncbi:MAG TPA: oligosaccharide flippase family protein [Coleofasciculaceae cyanobacterium]
MSRVLDKLKTLLPNGNFARSVTVLAGGTALGQGLVVLSLPLLSRLYTPEDIGKYGLYTAFVGIASVASSLLYEAAIVSAQDDDEAAHLTLLAITITILTVPPAILGFYALIRFNLLGFGILPVNIVILTLVALLLTTAFKALRYWLIRNNYFAVISQVTMFQGGIQALSQVGLSLGQLGWVGLLLGDILGRGFGLGRMLSQSWQELARWVWPIKLSRLAHIAAKYSQFPKYSLPSSLIDVLSMSLSVPLLTQLYGPVAGGYFVLAQRTLALPVGLVSSSTADAFHNQVASYARHNPSKLKGFFLQTARTLALIGLFPALTLVFLGPQLFSWVFGATWVESGLLAAVMAPWSLAGLVVSPLSRIVFVLSGQQWKLLYDTSAFAALVLAIFGGSMMGLPLAGSVALLSGLNVVAFGIYFWVLLRIVCSASKLEV